jgi:hypothetical protein
MIGLRAVNHALVLDTDTMFPLRSPVDPKVAPRAMKLLAEDPNPYVRAMAIEEGVESRRLELWTFQRNSDARASYEAQGFHAVGCTDGRDEENEPDVKYEWGPTR